MRITKIKIPLLLQPFTENNDKVEVNGTTVRDCLYALATRFPRVKEWLFDSGGSLKVIIVVNRQVVPQNKLDAEVFDNDQITIIIPMNGG